MVARDLIRSCGSLGKRSGCPSSQTLSIHYPLSIVLGSGPRGQGLLIVPGKEHPLKIAPILQMRKLRFIMVK